MSAARLGQWLSPADVAARLSMSLRWVRERIARGDFPQARRVGACVRVPETDVAAWMARQPPAVAPRVEAPA